MDTKPNNGDQLVAEITRGLVYTHNRANANTVEVHQTRATIYALVELLVDGGLIDLEILEARQSDIGQRLREQYLARGMSVAMQEFESSKYDFQDGADIDCNNRLPLCQAACCRLPLALSKEDVQEGIVRWDLAQPYMIAHDADGYCVHLDRGACSCTIYDQRPIPCRGYDCRQDQRIWLDFEKRVVNPRIGEPDWLECVMTESDSLVNGKG